MNVWYQEVDAAAELTQGDTIADCLLVGWDPDVEFTSVDPADPQTLESAVVFYRNDVVVLTQACDLEQRKVDSVVVCPWETVSNHRRNWEAAWKSEKQALGKKSDDRAAAEAWNNVKREIARGSIPHLVQLEPFKGAALHTDHRIVDFREVRTVPRSFLEKLLRDRGGQRLRVVPYHSVVLSRRFGDFFSRPPLPDRVPVAG